MGYGTGVIPSQIIKKMIANKNIVSEVAIPNNQIQPASLDLRLGSLAIRVRASFLTGRSLNVKEKLKHYSFRRSD